MAGRRPLVGQPATDAAPPEPGLPAAPRRAGWAVGVGLVGLAVGVGLAVIGAGSSRAVPTGPVGSVTTASDPTTGPDGASQIGWQRRAVTADGLVERLGIRIVRVAVTGGGGLLDLRYEVVDADKAVALHDPSTPPALVEESSGLVVDSLLMGHAHKASYKPGVTYYLVFENPGDLVQQGGKVSVLLGTVELEHVDVQ